MKKISVIVGNSSILTITSSHYFISSNAQKTLLQLTAISGMSVIGLHYQEQMEEVAKEVLLMLLEIICSYAGMLLLGTEESFKDYFHKIVPATIASKTTECYLHYKESYAITTLALPLIVSSLVYNQASIRESYQQLRTFSIHLLNKEVKKQLLQPVTSLITDHITNSFSNELSWLALNRTIQQACSSKHGMLIDAALTTNSLVGNQSLNHIFTPLFHPVIQQLLS